MITHMKRRIFLICLLMLSAILGCLWYGFNVEPQQLKLRRVTIESPYWTGEPILIGLMSDLHIGGPHIDPPKLDKIVGRMNVEQADIILLAGDYVNSHEPAADRSTAENDALNWGQAILGDLYAPLGVFAVLGNHDHLYGAQIVQANMEAQGINFIDNSSAVIDERLCLFGVADEYFGKPTDDGYYNCPANFPIVGLMHNPDSFFRIPSRTALMVAGHSHGGQINIPLIGRFVTSTKAGKPYAYGLNTVGDTPVFVTAGIGTSILAARFRSPPEIVLIELRALEPAQD